MNPSRVLKDQGEKDPRVCPLQEVDTALSAYCGGLAWLWVVNCFPLDILDQF